VFSETLVVAVLSKQCTTLAHKITDKTQVSAILGSRQEESSF
jgi:hypothetical protein